MCRDFDSRAICDTGSGHFGLQFGKRRLALLWGLTVHDKHSNDDAFLNALPLIKRGASDDRDRAP